MKAIKHLGIERKYLDVFDQGIVVGNPRQSSVAYVIGITNEKPTSYPVGLKAQLGKPMSMADIDLDMTAAGREEMIRYTSQRFGEDHVSQIITFFTIKARAAVRDSARVLGHPFIVGDKISKALPPAIMGRDAPLSACLELTEGYETQFAQAAKFREIYEKDHDAREIIDAAKGLEGLIRSDSIHAAAVVISDVPLTDIVPLQQKGKDQPIVTQYDMHGVEALGLLKMDFLGLRNLDVITECLRLIEEQGLGGHGIEMDEIPLDDPKTFELLQRGETIGVFQLESKAMRELVVRLHPETFDHIAALVALYRPGPMAANMHNDYADRKNLRKPVEYFHDDARDILADTQGLCIYQEQVMQIAQRFAGYSLAEADNLRKAMGKKIKEKMAAEKDGFISGCVKSGYSEIFAGNLFGMISDFADYGFNKSHAYGYAMTAYQTAYLKANYPTFYMAALCKGVPLEKASIFLAEARRMGIPVNLPSVNRSEVGFTATTDEIRVGLSSIAQVGEAFAEEVLDERAQGGLFKDMYDFVLRMVVRGVMNKRVFIPLVDAGALDEFGNPRLGLVGVVDEIMKTARKESKKHGMGMQSLFEDSSARFFDIPNTEYTPREKLALEKKVMGVYVSGHPMDGQEAWARENSDCDLTDLADLEDGRTVWVAGLVSDFDVRTTRAGAVMAHFLVSNHELSVNVIAFPKLWTEIEYSLEPDTIARLRLKPSTSSHSERDYILVEFEAQPQKNETVAVSETEVMKLRIPDGSMNNTKFVSKLKGILLSHRGSTSVRLHVGGSSVVALPDEYAVEPSEALVKELKELCQSIVGQ